MVDSAAQEAFVTFAPLADGEEPEDFTARLATLGDTCPIRVPREEDDPAAHDWLEGGWRQRHTTPARQTQQTTSTLFAPGKYVVFCFRDAEGGTCHLWPLGGLTVAER